MAGWFSGGAGRRGGLAKDFFTGGDVVERERDITKQMRQEDRTREEQKKRRDRRKERMGLMAKIKTLAKRKRPTEDADFFLAGEPVPVPREPPFVVVGGRGSSPRRATVPPFTAPDTQLWWDCDNEGAHPASVPASELVASPHCQVSRTKRGTRSKPYTVVSIRHTPTGVEAEATTSGKGQVELREVELHAAGRLRLALATYVRLTRHDDSPQWSPGPELLGRCTASGEIAVEVGDDDMPVVLMDIMEAFYANNLMISKLCIAIDGAGLFVAGPNDPGSIEPKEVVRLLARHPPAIHLINRERQKLSMMTLKRQRR